MDACCNTTSDLFHLFENSEINIDIIAIAVAELNNKIVQLRKEIIAFKNENEIYLTVASNSPSLIPSEFNDLTKNVGKRTDARYELQRNFKGDDSPGGTDLSARLSFTKRALEVKATNEAVVFKEDYPRDDKSIEDDERPNRSRVSEATGMYRKSISDAEKFGKEINGRSRNIRDIGDIRISCVADEKLKRANEHQNDIVNNMYCDYDTPNVTVSKIKRKRISRGVQYSSIGCQNHTKKFLLNCFESKSNAKKYNLTQKLERKEAPSNKKKFYIGSRNQANESLDATAIRKESRNVKLNDTDTKKKRFENGMKKIGKIICGRGMNHKILFVRSQNADDKNNKNRKNYNNPKINPLEKLWPSKALIRNNDNPKAQQYRSSRNFNITDDDSENNKKETDECNYENNLMNDVRKREHERNVNIFDRKINLKRKKIIINFERESIANKMKEKLDSCIVELNGIIGDACVIFGSGEKAQLNS
ncbi:uncharacterized protein LOC112637658 [Camponotus floridanus]|uniref:uncharacterized protein LOC112637658 n=1 Tax=Camponotus floridanus TaxID=104421 RepID=UPI000DC6BA0C|nr:uncharacterized protein LOC112637658 [Camponotus floridanus]